MYLALQISEFLLLCGYRECSRILLLQHYKGSYPTYFINMSRRKTEGFGFALNLCQANKGELSYSKHMREKLTDTEL